MNGHGDITNGEKLDTGSPYPPQSFPPATIKRKPIAITTLTVEDSPHHTDSSRHDRRAVNSATTHQRPFLTRAISRWQRLSKRTKIAIVVGVVLLLVLIIGLSAGLASRHRFSNLPLPSAHGGPYTGDLTYYDPGLGACGVTSTSSQNIVAVSHVLFDAVSTSSNPNANPLCGKKIRARRDGRSVDLTVVDRCVGCQAKDLDVSESVFAGLADVAEGRVTVQWAWLEDVPQSAAGS